MTAPSTIQEIGAQIRAGTVSPVELTEDCLRRIETLNPRLNAFITVLADEALSDARRAEKDISAGKIRGPLHGIPVGVKDILDTSGTLTTAASAQFKARIPTEDAEVVRRLLAAGAIIVGKQNLHEFAYGGSSLISYFGEVRNPLDESRVAGGSSGGSAAAVAAGLGFAALGTDTAGSVRLPAACCGVVGLKPTYGRVSCRGVIPLSWSYDHVGPITSSVLDAALMLQVIAGYDPRDTSSADQPLADLSIHIAQFPQALKIGVPRSYFFDDLDPEISASVEQAIDVFRRLNAEVRDINLEVSVDRTLSSAESWAFHAPMVAKTPELYNPITLARIQSGAKTSAAAVLLARRDLEHMRRRISEVFDQVDVLLTPTVPVPPPKIEDLKAHPDQLRPAELLMLRNTRPFNVWGIPAISVPCGRTKAGLPIGLQLASSAWREDLLFQVAFAFERAQH